ncbi:hypothetical protein OKW43_001604 [Paraburkholderia sp. WC7.3g]|uniref:tlde1 domain-containing protein n=1 Tax=Paraburkholderia sp. WC7.3g TaxID=2991070 RepID=UPI003D1DCB34
MAWIYKQTSGEMYHNGVLMEKKGYSGKGEGKNKRSKQYVRDKGPIPVGRYEITAPFDHTHTGKYSLRLNPVCRTCLGGRDGFMIHGDSLSDPGNASNGCIVIDKRIRKKMWDSGDRWLEVE